MRPPRNSTQFGAVHCIVTTKLTPTVVKCMLYGLDIHVPLQGIVCTAGSSKLEAFKRVINMCGPSVCSHRTLPENFRAVHYTAGGGPRYW